MAKFNWDRTRSENTATNHGSENYISDSLPVGYARGSSNFSPQIAQCPHCKINFTVGLLSNHLFACSKSVRKRSNVKKIKVVEKKVKAKKSKLKIKIKEPKAQKKIPVKLNTPFETLKDIVKEGGLKLEHPLKGAKIVKLVRKKT